ncbi:hypothetical protein V6N13_025750 [Hibiscus sabdariffa]
MKLRPSQFTVNNTYPLPQPFHYQSNFSLSPYSFTSMAMARGFPNHGVSSDGGSGSQYTTPSYSSFPISDSFYQASMSRGTIGDVFFGTDDMKDTRDLVYKGDVLESYQRETAVKYLRRRRSKKERISNFGCVELLKLVLQYCCRCIILHD